MDVSDLLLMIYIEIHLEIMDSGICDSIYHEFWKSYSNAFHHHPVLRTGLLPLFSA